MPLGICRRAPRLAYAACWLYAVVGFFPFGTTAAEASTLAHVKTGAIWVSSEHRGGGRAVRSDRMRALFAAIAIAIAFAGATSPALARTGPRATFTDFTLPLGASPDSIAADARGHIWFTEQGSSG